ncbi:MAG: amidohydrolase [Oscillospiraceae bacterium]|nr:amidohydrolase [Oscillospiraceae bacterium]
MLLIQNGTLYTMESEQPESADLLVGDGKILKIAPNIEPADGVERFDAAGLRIYPGFLDAHSHIGIAAERSDNQTDESNEGTNPVTPSLRAVDGINPMDSAFHNALASGVTAVMTGPGSANAVGGQFALIKTHGRRVDDMVVLAPAAVKIAFGENPMHNYGLNGNTPSTRMAVASLIREELFRARSYFDQNGSGDFSLECYRPLFEGNIPLKAHVHRADDIFTAIRIAEEFHLGLTLDHCTEGHLIADMIAQSGFPAIVGPTLASRTKEEVRLSDFKTPGILHHAGVCVALTTDHPVSRIQNLPLCAGLAAKEGMGKWAALRAITIDAARICRVDERLGSLKVGKDADLSIWDGDPLEIGASVRATVVDGEFAWKNQDRP